MALFSIFLELSSWPQLILILTLVLDLGAGLNICISLDALGPSLSIVLLMELIGHRVLVAYSRPTREVFSSGYVMPIICSSVLLKMVIIAKIIYLYIIQETFAGIFVFFFNQKPRKTYHIIFETIPTRYQMLLPMNCIHSHNVKAIAMLTIPRQHSSNIFIAYIVFQPMIKWSFD